MTPQTLFEKLVGRWQGSCRTWFKANELADESEIMSRFTMELDGKFLRHAYAGQIQGKARQGEELIAFNAITKQWQTTWIDSFHMNYAIMFSGGPSTDTGFEVRGEYDVGEGHAPWSWKTVYQLAADDRLEIVAFNISPEGEEAKALETIYDRIG